MVYLPTPKKPVKKTFIFDLDETLIHCNSRWRDPADVVLDMSFPDGV